MENIDAEQNKQLFNRAIVKTSGSKSLFLKKLLGLHNETMEHDCSKSSSVKSKEVKI